MGLADSVKFVDLSVEPMTETILAAMSAPVPVAVVFKSHDFFVACGGDIFSPGDKLFIQLFAGAQAGENDFDVSSGLFAGEADEIGRHIRDLYGRAHLQDEK